MINVLLVEDHHVVRDGLRMLLESDEHISIVGEAENGERALDILNLDDQIDLILTDLNMPVLDGIALAEKIKNSGSKVKVVILSMHDKETHIYKAFKAGASAYLLKSINPQELIFGLQHVHAGGRYLCSSLTMNLIESQIEKMYDPAAKGQPDLELSSREREVLELIAEGITNQGMSERLFLSRRTVEGHRQSLIDKFGVNNTAELIRSAMRSGQIH